MSKSCIRKKQLEVPVCLPLCRRNPLVFPMLIKIEICMGIPKVMKQDKYVADYFNVKLYHNLLYRIVITN